MRTSDSLALIYLSAVLLRFLVLFYFQIINKYTKIIINSTCSKCSPMPLWPKVLSLRREFHLTVRPSRAHLVVPLNSRPRWSSSITVEWKVLCRRGRLSEASKGHKFATEAYLSRKSRPHPKTCLLTRNVKIFPSTKPLKSGTLSIDWTTIAWKTFSKTDSSIHYPPVAARMWQIN